MSGMDQPLFKNLSEIRLGEHAMMFMNPNASRDEIVKSGYCIFVLCQEWIVDSTYNCSFDN
jgi:hypothetical protein